MIFTKHRFQNGVNEKNNQLANLYSNMAHQMMRHIQIIFLYAQCVYLLTLNL